METFSRCWPFVRGIFYRSPENSPTKANDAELWSFHMCLNRRLNKQSWGWWVETPSRSLWRHRNVQRHIMLQISGFSDGQVKSYWLAYVSLIYYDNISASWRTHHRKLDYFSRACTQTTKKISRQQLTGLCRGNEGDRFYATMPRMRHVAKITNYENAFSWKRYFQWRYLDNFMWCL